MHGTQTSLIHPSAIISREARLAEDVTVGPFVVIDGPVIVGAGSVIHAHAHLIGLVTLGKNNEIFTGAVIGGTPQHLAYKGEVTAVEIGDGNVIREYTTIH